ncbi:hypothetical protein [Paraflavitalea speifideaquila]
MIRLADILLLRAEAAVEKVIFREL